MKLEIKLSKKESAEDVTNLTIAQSLINLCRKIPQIDLQVVCSAVEIECCSRAQYERGDCYEPDNR